MSHLAVSTRRRWFFWRNGRYNHTSTTSKPACWAATSCRSSAETNRSACHATAVAICKASMARNTLVSSNDVASAITIGVRFKTVAATISDRRATLICRYCSSLSIPSRRRRLRAEIISGTHKMHSPSDVVCCNKVSTSSLPGSSRYRLAKAEVSKTLFKSLHPVLSRWHWPATHR